jgi:hypothetical protein
MDESRFPLSVTPGKPCSVAVKVIGVKPGGKAHRIQDNVRDYAIVYLNWGVRVKRFFLEFV